MVANEENPTTPDALSRGVGNASRVVNGPWDAKSGDGADAIAGVGAFTGAGTCTGADINTGAAADITSDIAPDAAAGIAAGACAAATRRERFEQLGREVAGLEGRAGAKRLPLGVASLDSALAGGLALGRVHMLCGRPGHDGALTGFVVALLRLVLDAMDDDAPIVWCPAPALGESGMLHASGLAALGLDPGRLLVVDSPNPSRRLCALEEILRTDGIACVVAEYDNLKKSSDDWMRLARRAQLAAEAGGVTGFVTGWPVDAAGFETRWHVAPGRDAVAEAETGAGAARPWHPVWDVELAHARAGRQHTTRLVWDVSANSLVERARGQSAMLPFADDAAAGPVPGQGGVAQMSQPALGLAG